MTHDSDTDPDRPTGDPTGPIARQEPDLDPGLAPDPVHEIEPSDEDGEPDVH